MYVIIYSLNLLLFHVVVVCFYGCYNLSSSTTKKNIFFIRFMMFWEVFFFPRWKLKKHVESDGRKLRQHHQMFELVSLSWEENYCGKKWRRFLCWYIGWYGRIFYTLTIVVVNNIDVLCFYIFSVLTSDCTVFGSTVECLFCNTWISCFSFTAKALCKLCF